ncbi:hypothetical protein GW17_00026532 [Ensete ventricosum]|nr:hypothetical protein GW17_00026532 [Ensete ventricosum]
MLETNPAHVMLADLSEKFEGLVVHLSRNHGDLIAILATLGRQNFLDSPLWGMFPFYQQMPAHWNQYSSYVMWESKIFEQVMKAWLEEWKVFVRVLLVEEHEVG